jgi:hypothetical protein
LGESFVDYAKSLIQQVTWIGVPGSVAIGSAVLVALSVAGARDLIVGRLRRPSSLSAPAWAGLCVGGLVAVKAVIDLVFAPYWALDWYSAPQRLFLPFGLLLLALAGVDSLRRFVADRDNSVLKRLGQAESVHQAREDSIGPTVRESRLPPRITRTLCWTILLSLVVMLVALKLDRLLTRFNAERGVEWQDTLDEAADWVLAEGPRGTYGARDAGLLGYRLSPSGRPVVNLDGLVNDYEFAEFVTRGGDGWGDRLRAANVDFLIQRLYEDEITGEMACGRELWRSPQPVLYYDSLEATTSAYVVVLDVRACLKT